MATPWDRPDPVYLEEWAPRFKPYQRDLTHELALAPGSRVLVTCAGAGGEAVSVARAVGAEGAVSATDPVSAMVELCAERARAAAVDNVACRTADLDDVSGGPFDAVVCAFGLWRVADRPSVLAAWRDCLTPSGKVGILTWGPADDGDPFERFYRALDELEPDAPHPRRRVDAERASLSAMFAAAGLTVVRQTVLRHTMTFTSAELFVRSLLHGDVWSDAAAALGKERMGKVAAHFYDGVGGPTAALGCDPAVTLAIAARPGAEVALAHRPSLTVPKP